MRLIICLSRVDRERRYGVLFQDNSVSLYRTQKDERNAQRSPLIRSLAIAVVLRKQTYTIYCTCMGTQLKHPIRGEHYSRLKVSIENSKFPLPSGGPFSGQPSRSLRYHLISKAWDSC